MASLMISQTQTFLPLRLRHGPSSRSPPLSISVNFSVSASPKPLRLSHRLRLLPVLAARVSFSSAAADATRTVCSLISAAASLSAVLSKWWQNLVSNAPSSEEAASLQNGLVCAMGPLLFAAKSIDLTPTVTPFRVVVAGMGKWLEIYSGILMLRVLFSWFPNVPWDKQPFSAIRDLCDPYLNLFRNVIPPLFNSLDVSPLLAFAILGVLTSLLNTPS